MRRMDRYQEDENTTKRIDKNQELYRNFASNNIYTNITDVTNANAYEIGSTPSNSRTRREDYQQMQKYQKSEPQTPNKKELEDFNYLYKQKETKVYDINSVLEQARKTKEKDAKEEKRKLKNSNYNILTSLDKEALEKYREEKKNRIMTPEEEEIRELIDTIASKTLAGEIDKATTVDLLSDLMATSILDKVEPANSDVEEDNNEPEIIENVELKEDKINQEDLKEIEEKVEAEENQEDTLLPGKDPDFYTRSMDLSDKDFDLNEEFKDKPMPIVLKILIILLILAVLAVAGYFIYQRMY